MDDKKALNDKELEKVSGGADFSSFTVGDWVKRNGAVSVTPDVLDFVWLVTAMGDQKFSAQEYQLRKEHGSGIDTNTWVHIEAVQEYCKSVFMKTTKPKWVV